MKKIIAIILISALGGALTLGAYKMFFEDSSFKLGSDFNLKKQSLPIHYTSTVAAMENTDFTIAAEKTLNTVVHVKNTAIKTYRDPWSELFYGEGYGVKKVPQIGTGSGVIISPDGYIITNNHVIREATSIEVTLNNKKIYKAEVIGTDADNDIALLKIDADELPFITFGDSDIVKVGEWVLAVGNPYNLTSTVTAGIVSAKGRDLAGNSNIDSFIQTDAAVNPGNSGGALVNTHGELVGINTAISSRTGSFIGYSFAVPSNIARKVVEDLMEFGKVQIAVLGVIGGELNSKIADELGVENTEGYYISEVIENSGAQKAGLKYKDIIVQIDGIKIKSFADLKGFLSAKRPGDIVEVTYIRNDKEIVKRIKLAKNLTTRINSLGLVLKNLSSKELNKLNIENGVKITSVLNNQLRMWGVEKGYVLVRINNKDINQVDDVNSIINNTSKGEILRVEMINLNGEKERYTFRNE
ncbi:MAG TPA: trypsin-like peptidase domain-containing protein [Flavobacteriaceae bacterium]|nr:trypsin-like peptidase domain-containing protein [Flavobacteriaceae bacterium]